jgi:hypothetical protein
MNEKIKSVFLSQISFYLIQYFVSLSLIWHKIRVYTLIYIEMKKIIFLSLLFFGVAFSLQAQTPFDAEVNDEILIEVKGDYLKIFIDDKAMEQYDLLIYKTYEDIKLNIRDLKENPYTVNIKD